MCSGWASWPHPGNALQHTHACIPFVCLCPQVQFLCIGSHYSQAYFNVNCPFPNFLCIGLVVQNTFMAAMFADFYVRTYWREPKPQHAKRVEAAAAATNGKVANGVNGVGQPINGSALNGHIKNGHAGSL